MSVKLKKIEDQVIVITGASSGIGLATAKMAVEKGARVVLCSRNMDDLDRIVDELNRSAKVSRTNGKLGRAGGRAIASPTVAIAVECDVADPAAVQRVADRAVQEFGGFDTWVNNAGVSIYGKLWEMHLEEKRRLFEVNFWGVVHGCRSSLKHMKNRGGAIINIGSVLSERAIPIQGIYSASKHAVKGYTDSLRMEVEAQGWPISVTLVKPGAIDTPYTEHAENKMKHDPVHTAPVYAPEVVASAILECAATPKRDVFVGGSGKFFSLLETFAPRLADYMMENMMMEKGQSSPNVHRTEESALIRPSKKEGRVRGNYPGHVSKTSAYTSATLHPGIAALIATGLGLVTAAGLGYLQGGRTQTAHVPRTRPIDEVQPIVMTH